MLNLNRNEWLELRKNHIGSSDAPVIINGGHFEKTPYKLWQEKLGLSDNDSDSYIKRRGREMEPIARTCYETYTGLKMEPDMIFHPYRKYMMATLDGISEDRKIAIEIKCPGEKDHLEAKKGKIPEKYMAQIMHQLACNDQIDCIHYFSYRGDDDKFLVEVERNDKYIETLYKKEQDFWDHVLSLEAPSLTNKDYIDLTDIEGIEERVREWKQRDSLLKQLKKEHDEDKKWFISQCGKNSAKANGLKITRIIAKGAVDYKAIPELQSINLEIYRKKPIEKWSIR